LNPRSATTDTSIFILLAIAASLRQAAAAWLQKLRVGFLKSQQLPPTPQKFGSWQLSSCLTLFVTM
jgi:hypothetical protein